MELNMPQMGYDMKEGTVVRWLKPEGAPVSIGEAIAEIETDKAVVEFESYAAGILHRLLVEEGQTVAVGTPIAVVGDDSDLPESSGREFQEASEPEIPDVIDSEGTKSIPLPASNQIPHAPRDSVRASPVARKIAEENGVDLSNIHGTGPGGRITKDDVLAFSQRIVELVTTPTDFPDQHASVSETMTDPSPVLEDNTDASENSLPLSSMRQQIARVTVKSKQEKPHFYVSSEIDMARAMELRVQINEVLESKDIRISVNDLIIKACADALTTYPKFNAFFDGGRIEMNDQINIGIAIAQEEGLILPAIIDCADKSLPEIAVASHDLVQRANTGTLRPEEYTGGTFSISNLGMFDVTNFVAIIHPPQTAVLAVGTVAKRPVVRGDQITISQTMTATLSADHRVVDGAEAAQFIVKVKSLLENPVGFFL